MVMRLAQDELARINSHTTPQAKLECIVACADILFRSLNLSRGADASRPGADEFLPVFIYVVLRANVRQVLANATYIDRFRYPGGLMSKYVPRALQWCCLVQVVTWLVWQERLLLRKFSECSAVSAAPRSHEREGM